MEIHQIQRTTARWSTTQIENALRDFPAEETAIAELQARRAYLLLPDTERCSRGVIYAIESLRISGQLTILDEQWSKSPVTGIPMCFEGWALYSTSLYFALGLLRRTTRYYDGRLRCALFVEAETPMGVADG